MQPLLANLNAIVTEFGPHGLQLVSIDRQGVGLHRIHFQIEESDLHLVVDEEALYVFNLDLTNFVLLEEDVQPDIILAALGAINRIQARSHYVRFLLSDPEADSIHVLSLSDKPHHRLTDGWRTLCRNTEPT